MFLNIKHIKEEKGFKMFVEICRAMNLCRLHIDKSKLQCYDKRKACNISFINSLLVKSLILIQFYEFYRNGYISVSNEPAVWLVTEMRNVPYKENLCFYFNQSIE